MNSFISVTCVSIDSDFFSSLSTDNQKKLVKQMFEGGVSATVQLEDWKKSLEIKELDRTLLALTVDKIYIYENKQIKIHIRYQDMIEKMKVIRRFYAELQMTSLKNLLFYCQTGL